MAAIPAAPVETGNNQRILFLTDDDGAGGLEATLLRVASKATVNGQKLAAIAVGVVGVASATNTAVNVATTANGTSVLSSNAARRFAVFVNDSDAAIYLHLSATGAGVIAHAGIRLNPQGGSFEINMNNLYTGAVAAIHAASGNKVLTVVEG